MSLSHNYDHLYLITMEVSLPSLYSSDTCSFNIVSKINNMFQRQSLVPKTMTPFTSFSNFQASYGILHCPVISLVRSLVASRSHVLPLDLQMAATASSSQRMTLLLDNANCVLTVCTQLWQLTTSGRQPTEFHFLIFT